MIYSKSGLTELMLQLGGLKNNGTKPKKLQLQRGLSGNDSSKRRSVKNVTVKGKSTQSIRRFNGYDQRQSLVMAGGGRMLEYRDCISYIIRVERFHLRYGPSVVNPE
jgi:hypothetical protein